MFLSGGLWQRLAVARGLMRAERDFLILDEPSSGMDAEAGDAGHARGGSRRRAGWTSLLISHRLGSVRDADMIYVLSERQIAEQGTHATLMTAGGEYRRLFTLQASAAWRLPKIPARNSSRDINERCAPSVPGQIRN